MKKFVTYDPVTGEILGRYVVSDDTQVENYSDRLEIGEKMGGGDFENKPELWWKVDVGKLSLIDLSDKEIKKKQGLKEDDVTPDKPVKEKG